MVCELVVGPLSAAACRDPELVLSILDGFGFALFVIAAVELARLFHRVLDLSPGRRVGDDDQEV